ncbi:MAG: hypothetical protein HY040_16460 [Planctomycetes bacterium]|nr:hypothetical protein [Planctomycetota bacterium]
MFRFLKLAGIGMVALAAVTLAPLTARAQYVVQPAPVVTYYPAPTRVYYAPAPVTYSYYLQPGAVVPTTVYAPPVTYAYYPQATTVYSAPAVVTPGYVTTRSYYGLGVFRPRGWTTEQYFTPGVAPVTSYYTPVFVR